MKYLVSGLVNIETTLKIAGFPLAYHPVHYAFHGIGASVSGVGVNVAKALRVLGGEVNFLSLVGQDSPALLVRQEFAGTGVDTSGILEILKETPQSVILYDASGRRQIQVDLKDIQDWEYPLEAYEKSVSDAQAAVLCNINFNRPLLARVQKRGIPLLTDVHVLSDPRDAYNQDFMAHADVLFFSDEGLWASPEDCCKELLSLYPLKALVMGRGDKGALLCERGRPPVMVPAVQTRPVVNTIGAGDALFSAFTSFWTGGTPMADALRKAVLFASWKIGEKGAASGFLTPQELEELESTPS